MLPLLLLLSQVESPEPSPFRFNARVAAGSEWDTNARRAIPGTNFPSASNVVVSDGLVRLLLDSALQIDPARQHRISIGHLLGAKRFFREETEDLLVNSLTLATVHGLTDWLTASTTSLGKMSRIRNGSRDYDLFVGDVTLTVTPISWLDVELQGGFSAFRFPVEPRFDYLGARAGTGIRARPLGGLSLSVGFDWVFRFYDGLALVKSAENELIEGDDPRKDDEAQLSVDVFYRSWFIVGGGYLLRLQRSNSDVENIDRHRLSVFAAVDLPYDFTLNLLAALQVNIGTSFTDTRGLAEDDENQNSVQVGISYRIVDELTVEARYALFANQFSTNDINFLRQTFYLGVGYRAGR